MEDKIVFNKYIIEKQIARGSFARIYKAKYKDDYYCLKIEKKKDKFNLLHDEAQIMSYLKGPYIPSIKEYITTEYDNILVMQLLGKSLQYYFELIGKFSIKTVSMLAYQMLNCIQYIHEKHILHRDIKPDNFVLGKNDLNSNLYLIDFGLSKKYRSSRTLVQYPFRKKKNMTGTARYGSINALEGMEQGRRDDLEAMGYVLMFLLRGNLPWQGLKITNRKDRYKKILEIKKETTPEVLCKDFPVEFCNFVKYAKNLGYTECPDYERLKRNFQFLVCDKRNEKFDYIYDWTTAEDVSLRSKKYEEEKKNDMYDYRKLNTIVTEGDRYAVPVPYFTPRNFDNNNNNSNMISKEKMSKNSAKKSSKKLIDYDIILGGEDKDDDDDDNNIDKLDLSDDKNNEENGGNENVTIDESKADKILKEEGIDVDEYMNEHIQTECCILF